MEIIQEIPSFNGIIRTNVIQGVSTVSKADQQILKGFSTPQWTIWCKLPKGRAYPIAGFHSAKKRDETFIFLKEQGASTVLLDYNERFPESYMTERQVREYLLSEGISLHTHLKTCIGRIMEDSGCKLVSLGDLDAFKDFSIHHLHRWTEGSSMKIDVERAIKYSQIWAKCLYTPKKLMSIGMSPHQFFNNLIKINNENT